MRLCVWWKIMVSPLTSSSTRIVSMVCSHSVRTSATVSRLCSRCCCAEGEGGWISWAGLKKSDTKMRRKGLNQNEEIMKTVRPHAPPPPEKRYFSLCYKSLIRTYLLPTHAPLLPLLLPFRTYFYLPCYHFVLIFLVFLPFSFAFSTFLFPFSTFMPRNGIGWYLSSPSPKNMYNWLQWNPSVLKKNLIFFFKYSIMYLTQ